MKEPWRATLVYNLRVCIEPWFNIQWRHKVISWISAMNINEIPGLQLSRPPQHFLLYISKFPHWNNTVMQPSKCVQFSPIMGKQVGILAHFSFSYGGNTILKSWRHRLRQLDLKTILYTILPIYYPWTVAFRDITHVCDVHSSSHLLSVQLNV